MAVRHDDFGKLWGGDTWRGRGRNAYSHWRPRVRAQRHTIISQCQKRAGEGRPVKYTSGRKCRRLLILGGLHQSRALYGTPRGRQRVRGVGFIGETKATSPLAKQVLGYFGRADSKIGRWVQDKMNKTPNGTSQPAKVGFSSIFPRHPFHQPRRPAKRWLDIYLDREQGFQ